MSGNNSRFAPQVHLLVRVLPFVAKERCFALKGGTAINLFVRDLPRLSVDIDLTYLPIESREDSLRHVHEALGRIATDLRASLQGCSVVESYQDSDDALRLTLRHGGAMIKIELSPVLRGSVMPPVLRTVTERVEQEFGFAEMQVLDLPDLYGGKICAALDRQHPRHDEIAALIASAVKMGEFHGKLLTSKSLTYTTFSRIAGFELMEKQCLRMKLVAHSRDY